MRSALSMIVIENMVTETGGLRHWWGQHLGRRFDSHLVRDAKVPALSKGYLIAQCSPRFQVRPSERPDLSFLIYIEHD